MFYQPGTYIYIPVVADMETNVFDLTFLLMSTKIIIIVYAYIPFIMLNFKVQPVLVKFC